MILFGSLLWIDQKNHSSINNKNKNIESYFKQIDVLNKTLLKSHSASLYVFSNNIFEIESWFKFNDKPLPNLISISATYQVPFGTPFFGAHYKLEALDASRKLLRSSIDRFILLDADVIALRQFTSEQVKVIENSDLVVYDISDQVFPAYGVEKVNADLSLLISSNARNLVWYGGEFISGSRRGLDRLLSEAHKVLPTYFEHIKSFHHVGDEMFVSAALNVINNTPAGLIFVEQKHHKLVTRHWSRFAKPSVDEHMQSVFLHLPGSKPLLELLSIFDQPLNAPVRTLLKSYSLLVRFYQLIKSKGAT